MSELESEDPVSHAQISNPQNLWNYNCCCFKLLRFKVICYVVIYSKEEFPPNPTQEAILVFAYNTITTLRSVNKQTNLEVIHLKKKN